MKVAPFPRNLFAALFIFSVAATNVYSQAYPSRPVRISTIFSVGSGPDIVLRLIAERLSSQWGQSVVVENRVGANGIIVMEALKRAPATGLDLVLVDWGPLAALPALSRTPLPYDSERDFAPITAMFDANFFLVSSSKSQVNSARELIAQLKSNPGKGSFATLGVGSTPHLAAAAFNLSAGINAVHIPYKGQGDMVNAVASSDVDYMFISAASAAPATGNGRAKLLAIGAKQRLHTHPDIPTLAEAAGLDIEAGGWVGFFAPRATPKEIVAKINTDIVGVLKQPAVSDRIRSMGFVPLPMTPEGFTTLLEDKRRNMVTLIKATGIQID